MVISLLMENSQGTAHYKSHVFLKSATIDRPTGKFDLVSRVPRYLALSPLRYKMGQGSGRATF